MFGCQDTIDTASKSSKFQAAGLNLHGRYLRSIQSRSRHTARRRDNSSIKTKVVRYWYWHSTCTPNSISLDDFDFNSQKDTVKIGQALENPVIAVAQGTGWVNAVLICDDFPELGTNLVSALASQAREMCRCICMPQHVYNWLEDTSGMSEKEGTRVHCA